MSETGKLVLCPLCKCMRLHFAGPHAPHWVKGVLVDCVGNVVWR
jgi:hypothetical protein